MRVKLVVTGDVEKLALKKSLERYFQETSSGARVEFLPPRKVHGITTYPLKPLPPDEESSIPRDVEAMARAVVAEVCEGADGKPADLVVAIDDLEIANHFEPHRVTSWVRRGMEREIARRSQVAGWGFAEKLRRRVRERCSFHLLVPMIEAYFFAEEAALQRIGVSSEHPPRLTRRDVEHFETDDPCSCRSRNRRTRNSVPMGIRGGATNDTRSTTSSIFATVAEEPMGRRARDVTHWPSLAGLRCRLMNWPSLLLVHFSRTSLTSVVSTIPWDRGS